MNPGLVFAFPENLALAERIAWDLKLPLGKLNLRSFPDGETYLRVEPSCAGREAILVCSLDHPDAKVVPLILAAETVRDLGATHVVLVAPYLAYMRQDHRFQAGEAVSARYFAGLLSRYFDGLVTVDPHLHRIHSLHEIYSMPFRMVHAAARISEWIQAEVQDPLLIGPDSESAQWVAEVARQAEAPFVVSEKLRRGDRQVEVSVPEVERWQERRPVLVDDIISTGRTMIETIGRLREARMKAPICIGVHAVFVEGAYEALLNAGAAKVATADTIPHPSNQIDLSSLLTEATRDLLMELRNESRGK